ncbi:L-threonylcarbamoyladenylate synthase [Gammaproteobacteria bacterium AB-CW1]|uniref:Threonylcarbamoyl-AMP synthase n=2 Tax=Natronospira elongata TaxID=3110268 RepID=A0AAP6JFL7_9GAMM|nr:L-threonylcarbamoyladenylate synthase [Gammaproteobacteria bacterium AB-CW1]
MPPADRTLADHPGLDEAVEQLRAGGVIAYPTEGVFGVGCDALDEGAVLRVLSLKQRERRKGLIVIGYSLPQLESLIRPLSREQRQALEESWPGAVTWIVPAAEDCPEWLTGGRSSLAVRVPDHDLARELCRRFRGPLVSTSANLSGDVACRTAAAVRQAFPSGLDAILDAPVGDYSGPSEIRDLASGRILRAGAEKP